ncbi:hypothetical protein [Bilophila wadsworthia]|uniref:hypothetical protein n=1 Tax=Bilophila wadsworthia TaxID=35833 RepID=UPI002432FF78|nr:hypothetical protein [Bilophila wadsworthia]
MLALTEKEIQSIDGMLESKNGVGSEARVRKRNSLPLIAPACCLVLKIGLVKSEIRDSSSDAGISFPGKPEQWSEPIPLT